jgi:replicative superfamily II helicase
MLADKLYNLKSFMRQFNAVTILSVCRTIENMDWEYSEKELLEAIDWNNIISIASALAYSKKNEHLDASLRISQTVLLEKSTSVIQKEAAAVILLSLTNNPAVQLAIDRKYLKHDFQNNLPFTLKLQNDKLTFGSSIILNETVIQLNRFQNDVYICQLKNDSISISAPTSAGKSFILCNILIEKLLKKQTNIIYVVPTRALISQVESDFRELLSKYNLPKVNITTVPQNIENDDSSNIFVFTQERLHWFLCESQNLTIDIFVIDEAHKIEDSYRGILLQQKIEQVVKENPNLKVYFSSPFTSNPEILLENVKNGSLKDKVNTQFIAVNQNLIYATQVPRKTNKWQLDLCLIDKSINLGVITLQNRPNGEFKKMAFIANSFSNNGTGNIIYSNGAADAENISLILFDSLPDETISENIKELIKLIKKTIHKGYRLAKVLQKRIAFHYGNMPLLVREEVEKLFKTGEIKYLICTSTLLEGVNLPAKSIFIRKPNRGNNKPMNQNDFWNLAGRAGRWGKEFSGNIICIEPQDWKTPPNPNKTKQLIQRALDKIENNCTDLAEFIENGSLRKEAERRPDLEFAFGYYYTNFLNGDKLSRNISLNKQLLGQFETIKEKIKIPANIIKRNPGISPLAQQLLWDYFTENLHRVDEMVPVYPEDENAYQEYAKLIGRIGKTISVYPSQLTNSRSILLIYWMSGKPLSFLIKKSYKSYKKNPEKYKSKTIHVVIREVMKNVEDFVRFRFAKDSSCYIDILRHFLTTNSRHDLLENVPQLSLWLEFGVAQKTHLSFLSLGLTRNSVIELSSFIANTEMSKEEALEWLKDQNLDYFDLSPIIIKDIRKILTQKA